MSNQNPTVISKQRMSEFLFNRGFPDEKVLIPGSRYALPSKKWLFSNPTAASIERALRRDMPTGYQTGPSVCYHFSSITVNELKRLHRISKYFPKGTDFAVGKFHFIPDSQMKFPIEQRAGHAIVCAIWSPDEGVTLDLAWMEPQTRQQVFVNDMEISRCSKLDFE